MVGMGVRDHHRYDRALAEFFIDKVQRSLGGFLRHQRVEHNPARIALDERDVRQRVYFGGSDRLEQRLRELAWQ